MSGTRGCKSKIVMYLLVKVGRLWLRRCFLPPLVSLLFYLFMVITSAAGHTQAPVTKPSQYGFLSRRSCQTNLLEFLERVGESLRDWTSASIEPPLYLHYSISQWRHLAITSFASSSAVCYGSLNEFMLFFFDLLLKVGLEN